MTKPIENLGIDPKPNAQPAGKQRSVQLFAKRTAGEVVAVREQLERNYRIAIGKPLSDLRKSEVATLHALYEQHGVGLETVALHELPQNRADRRRLLRDIDDSAVRAIRRKHYGKRRRRAS